MSYPLVCNTCGSIGTADDGIEIGSECPHDWCDGTIVANLDPSARVNLDWLHSLVQELEAQGVELPMGDYGTVYAILETLRDGAE